MTHFMSKPEIDFKEFEARILEFNEIAGNELTNKELIPTYTKLLIEEATEFLIANAQEDKVEFIDGLVDIGVIGIYLAHLLGNPPELVYWDYEYIDLEDAISTIEYTNHILLDCLDDHKYLATQVLNILEAFVYICNSVNVDIQEAFKLVMDNNLAKFPKIGELDPHFECILIEEKGRYGGVHFKERQGHFIFFALEDKENNNVFSSPKIIKHTKFVEVSLEDLV